jgi:hypothetical protein
MRHTTISGHHGTHDAQAAVFWILGGIIVVLAFRDVLTLWAVALGILAIAWWISHEAERRMERSGAARAPVTRLRPASTGQPDLKRASPHASWHGPGTA